MTPAALGDDFALIERRLGEHAPIMLSRPRRGRALWRDVRTFFSDATTSPVEAWESLGEPTLVLWQAVGHEAVHGHALGMGAPWSSDDINQALCAMPVAERAWHEIRAQLGQHEFVAAVTGVRVDSRRGVARLAAIRWAGAVVTDRLYGGDIRAAGRFAVEVASGEHLAAIREAVPAARSLVSACLRRHDPAEDARAALASALRAKRSARISRPPAA